MKLGKARERERDEIRKGKRVKIRGKESENKIERECVKKRESKRKN